MRIFYTVLIQLIFAVTTFSQSTTYWQQRVDTKIEVELNDTIHSLDGFVTISYQNNSPQTLTYILMHLWPNAYRDLTTPLAKQLLETGRTDFYYSKPNQRGFIDHLNFKANAEACEWDYEPTTMEIVKINLNSPLKSGEIVTISTPFRVKLPETFSRMGHIGQSYQISQWFPKPAVYDKTGWHAMPYLDQGEFYSEFGSYDVSITLPQNYVVGATGDLQTESEIAWLDSIAEATKKLTAFSRDLKFPVSSSTTKTIRFTQNNIHDFAWFADKRYNVLKGEVELPYSKNKVTTWSLFTNNEAELWSKSPDYLHDAIYYYSLWLGDYKYKQVTAVDGTISAGGGMEYPNITIIGEEGTAFSLDDVITHEVGHNWFYGMLGSNEREHAWMDEGINSFYEERYIRTKYPQQKILQRIPNGIARTFDLAQYKHKYLMDLGYQYSARENFDQALEQASPKFTNFNYGAMVYGKSMLLFEYLEAYLGTDKFDSIMKKYFTEWHFKHPQPEDIRGVFETETKKDLRWFFDDLIKTDKKIDYSISKVKLNHKDNRHTISIKNKGEVASPVLVSLLKKDSIVGSVWINMDGISNGKALTQEFLSASEFDKIQIDPQLKIPEINRRNNTYIVNKAAHFFEKLRFQFLGSIENQNRTVVNFAPYVAWNNYDKTQVGIALYSPFLPARKFNYMVVPTIGTGSKQFIGIAKFSYNFYPDKLQRFTLGINGKRFSYLLFPNSLQFNKIEPYINVEFKKKDARSPYTNTLNMRSVIVWLDWINFDNKRAVQRYYVNEFRYKLVRNSTLHPFNVSVTLQQGNDFAGLFAEGNFQLSYKRKNEGFFIRVYAGGFPVYFKPSSDIAAPLPRVYLSTVTNNNFAYWLQQDYMLDEHFIDRNGRDKYLGRQVANTGGAFRSITSFGATNKFLSAVNLTSTTHRFFPIQPFVNAAFILNELNKPEVAAELGLSAVILRNMIEIHLPLLTTNNIKENQKVLGITKWYQRFTFTLKLQLSKPGDIIRRFL
jgi:hypothetical protein